MMREEGLAAIIAEKSAAYLEHLQNTEHLIAVEKEWRLAKEQGEERRAEVLIFPKLKIRKIQWQSDS